MSPRVACLTSIVSLAAWLGAALLVAAVVAPAAFAVLPSRALAGALVGRVLPVVFLAGIVVGTLAAIFRAGGYEMARLGAGVATGLFCAVAQLGIAPRIEAVRAAIGPSVEALAPGDARRVAFGRLHGLSVLCLGAAMLAALVALSLAVAALNARETAR